MHKSQNSPNIGEIDSNFDIGGGTLQMQKMKKEKAKK